MAFGGYDWSSIAKCLRIGVLVCLNTILAFKVLAQPQAPVPSLVEPRGDSLFRNLKEPNPFVLHGRYKASAPLVAPSETPAPSNPANPAPANPGQPNPNNVVAATSEVEPAAITVPDTAAILLAERVKFGQGRNIFALGEGGDYEKKDNPFAVSSSSTGAEPKVEETPIEPEKPLTPEEIAERARTADGWLFYVLLSILAYMTTLVSVYRHEVLRLFAGFANINIAMQQFRDRANAISITALLHYILFIAIGGCILFLMLKLNAVELPYSPFMTLVGCMAGVAVVYILKHLQLILISSIFPFGAESTFYSFLISNANRVLGVVLVPMAFLVAYAPENLKFFMLGLTLVIWFAVVLYSSIRGLLTAGNYLLHHKFHFLMYLCAAEIAPILVLVKIILNG